ncbi:MAG: hypothetical protein ACK4IK_01765 [Bacteroidia bacterium]
MWNSPIYTFTNRTGRMKLNGTFGGATPQYTINGFTGQQKTNLITFK